jgi:micrococcal nuclease
MPRLSHHPAVTGLALLVLLTGSSSCGRATHGPPGEATVVEVIDGDTIVVDLGPSTETVRLLGVDTPETKHPTEPVECFGPEASAFTDGLLAPGTKVRLERDLEARDTFGRLLAYVHRSDDDLFVNLELLREGYADVLVIAPNEAYAEALRAAAAASRSAGIGLWTACGGVDTVAGGATEAIPSAP